MAAPGNVTKYAVSHQYEQHDGTMVCHAIFQQTILFTLAHKLRNISAERIDGQKQNSLTKQEPEGTYNIDLNNFFKKIGQVAKSQFPRKLIL